MRFSISLVWLFLFFLCATAKKNPDGDFSEFDDFDQDEFTDGMFTKFYLDLRIFSLI
jgi:hypothetical protein